MNVTKVIESGNVLRLTKNKLRVEENRLASFYSYQGAVIATSGFGTSWIAQQDFAGIIGHDDVTIFVNKIGISVGASSFPHKLVVALRSSITTFSSDLFPPSLNIEALVPSNPTARASLYGFSGSGTGYSAGSLTGNILSFTIPSRAATTATKDSFWLTLPVPIILRSASDFVCLKTVLEQPNDPINWDVRFYWTEKEN